MMHKCPEQLAAVRKRARARQNHARPRILVGAATCGLASGAGPVLEALRAAAATGAEEMEITETGCNGACYLEPIVEAVLPGKTRVMYGHVKPGDAPMIIQATVNGTVYEERALCRVDADEILLEDVVAPYRRNGLDAALERIVARDAHPFFRSQRHIAMRNCGVIDPASLEEYVARGGYAGAAKALLEMRPESIIEAIKRSGLRGRGGGGFPTGRKWEACRKAPGEPKYVICNADEGDPGAYMDRAIIEGDPHSIIEGMIIGSYAIGAHLGYIYVRQEYPLAVRRLRLALQQAEEAGFLGTDIFGSGHEFTIQINRGAGAFVCGESTALMASLEGRVGEPRAKYIHTVEFGLWNKPSCLNNVETWNNVPAIIQRGADWYAGIGTTGSKGTKVFSLVGSAKRAGLVEVPMGVSLREVVEEIGGGVTEGRTLKAIQTGGPSGGCIPATLLDVPVDYESLGALGSMMGSGGLVVMDNRTCMVDVARYFTAFLKEESCGKCVPCREGSAHMLDVLTRICEGAGRAEDIPLLEELSVVMTDGSLCALGGSAPNPVLSTLKYFRNEYQAHIDEHRCPAGVCKALLTYRIVAEDCSGCDACVDACPSGAISGDYSEAHVIDESLCARCGLCVPACPQGAIILQ